MISFEKIPIKIKEFFSTNVKVSTEKDNIITELSYSIESFFKRICKMQKEERNKTTRKLLDIVHNKLTHDKIIHNNDFFEEINEMETWQYNKHFQMFYVPSILCFSYIFEMTKKDGREKNVFADFENNQLFFNEVKLLSFRSSPVEIRSAKAKTTQANEDSMIKKYLLYDHGKPPILSSRKKEEIPGSEFLKNFFKDVSKHHDNYNLVKKTEEDKEFEDKINDSLKDDESSRLERLQNASKTPERTTVLSVGYKRNPDVIAQVILNAKGVCQYCLKPAPFKKPDGAIYLEVHHIIHLSEGGNDSVKNAIALCPNCHKEAHFGSRKDEMRKEMQLRNNI